MGRKSPKAPPEDASVTRQREQSILDLAKLDEEENLRVKQLRSASKGVRAFRAFRGQRSSSGSASVMGGSSGGAASGDAGGSYDGWNGSY